MKKPFSFLYQKISCILLCVLLLALQIHAAANQIRNSGERDMHVRVLLSRLNLKERMDLTLTAPYQLELSNELSMYFQSGSELTFLISEDNLILHYQGMSIPVGKSVNMHRIDTETSEKQGFYLTNFPALYLGDLHLSVTEGSLHAILRIHVEDYLLGVVPYEMSNAFPLEALKAQAVAARTYALRNQNQYDKYDVVDTTNDQVFKGYIPGNERAEQAVWETRGICGSYKGRLAQCYYSASNGGQMEAVNKVWPGDMDFGYYATGDDPYDLANPESIVRRVKLNKYYGNNETAPYALRLLLSEKLMNQFEENDFDTSPESIRVDRVNAVAVDTPADQGSKLMTMLHMSFDISIRPLKKESTQIIDQNPDEVSLFSSKMPINPYISATDFIPVATIEPRLMQQPEYGEFTPLEEPIVLSIPIFPDAEDSFGMNIISNYENEIWSIKEDEKSFTIEARRYGHGVGMSQRGAQWMAAEYGKSYQEILKFYYPGMDLVRYNDHVRNHTVTDLSLLTTPGPAPSPTPRPTLMPVTHTAGAGQWYAKVTEIAEDSSLNLRSEPSLNADILMRIYKGQLLLVLERCPQEGWVHVKTDTAEGYVLESFLTDEIP